MAFVHHRIVRFGDTDPAGIVFFARVFEFAHEAFEDFMAASGLPIQAMLQQREWAMPLVHAEADYRAPMRLGDALAIDVCVVARSDSSLTFGFEVRGAEDGVVHAVVRHVHVAIDRVAFRKRALPDEVLTALDRAEIAAKSEA